MAFEWCPEGPGANCDIYVKQVGVEPPVPLTTGPAEDFSPAWSPDGQFIAFLRRLSPSDSSLVIVPEHGGRERVLVESGVTSTTDLTLPALAWTPDSKLLVFPWTETGKTSRGLFLLSVDTLEKRRLTERNDATPAFSPDGRRLVFTRWVGHRSEMRLLQLAANYEPAGASQSFCKTAEPMNTSLVWTADGREIVFASSAYSFGGLWRVAATGSAKPRRLPVASEDVGALAVSWRGKRLTYTVPAYKTSLWRIDLRGPSRVPGTQSQLIPSTRNEWAPAYSPDGRKIAFCWGRSGHLEIWVCDADGSNALQLTSLGGEATGAKWSPDGRKIAFGAFIEGSQNIYVISAAGGAPSRLTSGPNDRSPCWFRDSKSIYFRSQRNGNSEIWKMPAAGGDAVQITRNGGDLPQESPDGMYLYYLKGDRYPERCSVWKMPSSGGEETKVLEAVHCAGHWSVRDDGIYFFRPPDEKGRSEISFYDFGTRKATKVLTLDQKIAEWMTVSPDGRTILYTQIQTGSDLMLVDNFR